MENYGDDTKTMKIASLADIHVQLHQEGRFKDLFTKISQEADVLCIAGDLTGQGMVEEGQALLEELRYLTIPCVMVLGNHDYEWNKENELCSLLTTENTFLLEGIAHTINGVGFAGVKGYIGGFENHVLPFWGEQSIKDIVQTGTNEALKLERAISMLETDKKVIVMHYSPIKATIEGEHPEIFPFLGSTRFEEAINRYTASVVFHGHAHKGTLSGKTSIGIPVFNVSLPVLEDNKKEFLLYDV